MFNLKEELVWSRRIIKDGNVKGHIEVHYNKDEHRYSIQLDDYDPNSTYRPMLVTLKSLIIYVMIPIYWFGDNVTLSELFKVDGFCMFDINYSNDNHSDIHFKASSQDFSFENDTARNLAIVKKYDGSDIIRTGVVFPYDGTVF